MDTKPNIVWVSFEDCLPLFGCYGDNVATTPNVDKLASEGCIYPNAFSTAPICAPARAGVITGMYPTSIGGHNMRISQGRMDGEVRPNHYDAPTPHFVKCLGEYFRREGYYCSNNVKTDYQFSAPFAAWDDCSEGAHWRDHGPKPRGKRHIYDSGIHSPMIVRWPGQIDPGSTNDRLVSTVDLGATMLSACDITVPPHNAGQGVSRCAGECRKAIHLCVGRPQRYGPRNGEGGARQTLQVHQERVSRETLSRVESLPQQSSHHAGMVSLLA